MNAIIQPILMAGGSGTRLWPLSRRDYPKQFVTLTGGHSLFQEACTRVAAAGFAPAAILGHANHRFLIAEQALEAGIQPSAIVLEPALRDTAPAACTAALLASRQAPDQLVLLMPCDHLIPDAATFRATVQAGVDAAKAGKFVVYGVKPTSPHTGYGYIEVKGKGGAGAMLDVARFVEKPTQDVAETYLKSGRFLWNAGIFLFRADAMLEAFRKHQPEILKSCEAALGAAQKDMDFIRLDPAHYETAKKISFDYAIMEKSNNLSCVALDCAWSDCGSWSAVQDIVSQDADGNAVHGDVMLESTRNSLAYNANGTCLVLIGLENVVAVATNDAILVASKEKSAEVKSVVEKLTAAGRSQAVEHKRVQRPWGWYESISNGDRYQAKCICVKPGAKLSLQSHKYRAEHWIVVSGSIEVTRDNENYTVRENESTYIPLGARHRMANVGSVPALLIEVQSGSYLGEDDIIRYEDVYGRAGS